MKLRKQKVKIIGALAGGANLVFFPAIAQASQDVFVQEETGNGKQGTGTFVVTEEITGNETT
ncbi:MAG: hypothetical protein WA896_13740, partial [Spirulinaceae cyanobacterium]